jgi:succinate-acetate transporter protein
MLLVLSQTEQTPQDSTRLSVSLLVAHSMPMQKEAMLTMFFSFVGFFQLWMGVLCLIYMICALRTNMVFVGIFFSLVCAFGCLAGAYWHLAEANVGTATTLIVAGGACTFVTCMLGWWIFFAILLASLDFPFQLPGKSMPQSFCVWISY